MLVFVFRGLTLFWAKGGAGRKMPRETYSLRIFICDQSQRYKQGVFWHFITKV